MSILSSYYLQLYFLFVSYQNIFTALCVLYQTVLADEEEEYEEAGSGSRLLGFMFGNVNDSGDLDVDYLDEVTLINHFNVNWCGQTSIQIARSTCV